MALYRALSVMTLITGLYSSTRTTFYFIITVTYCKFWRSHGRNGIFLFVDVSGGVCVEAPLGPEGKKGEQKSGEEEKKGKKGFFFTPSSMGHSGASNISTYHKISI